MAELYDAALLLRSIPYREHSLICHFLTRHHGRLALLVHKARGQRKHGHLAELAPMHELSLRWRCLRGELGVLLEVSRHAAVCAESHWLYGQYITAMANDLFREYHDHAYDDLQQAYQMLTCYQDARTGQLAAQWQLLMAAGWAAPLTDCWQCGSLFGLTEKAQPLWHHGQLHCHQCSQGVALDQGLLSLLFHAQQHTDCRLHDDACRLWENMRDSVLYHIHQT